MPDALSPRHLTARLAQIALVVGVGLLLLAALPGLGEVRARLAGAQPIWIVASLLLELGSVAAFVVVFRGVFCRRMPWGLSAQLGLSEQAANVLLPAGGAGGLALGAWALSRLGMAGGQIARRTVAFFLITSSMNFFCIVAAGTLVLAGVLPGDASVAAAAIRSGLALLTIIGVLALPRVLPGRPEAPVGGDRLARLRHSAAHVGATVADGVRDAVGLLRAGRIGVIAGALGYLAFDIAALEAAFQAFGSSPQAGDFLLAYVIGQLGGLVPVPGGIGGTDGGLVAALTLYGTPLTHATAAVLAYRAFQLGVPALAGTVAFAQLRRTLARESRGQDAAGQAMAGGVAMAAASSPSSSGRYSR